MGSPEIKPLPTEFDGGRVMAGIHVPSEDGEAPHLVIIIYDRGYGVHKEAARFAVTELKANFAEGPWIVVNGLYDKTWPQASELFAFKCETRNQRRSWDN